MIQLRELDRITYRAPLALHFVDAATDQAITNGLRVRAWPHTLGSTDPVRQITHAEKSPNRGLYGFRSLPGLEGYQIGDDIVTESISYLIFVEDQLGRFLPQIEQIDLPLSELAAYEMTLFPAPTRAIPPGYGAIRGQLLRTTAPSGGSQVMVVEAARWASIAISLDGGVATAETFADERGIFLAIVPYPSVSGQPTLMGATWNGTIAVSHSPVDITANLTELNAAVPNLNPPQLPPTLDTLTSQNLAQHFGTVSVVDSVAQEYTVVGAADNLSADIRLQFRRPTIVQTQIDSGDDHLSEFLIHSV